MDEKGYVLLTEDQQTTEVGVYAIGDISDPKYKQAVSAAGDGAKAAMQAEEYLRDLQLDDKTISYMIPQIKSSSLLPVPPKKKIALTLPVKEVKKKLLPEVIEITSTKQFDSELADANIPVIVDFYATWCNPCKKIASYLTKAAVNTVTKVKFLKVNVDKNASLAKNYQIKSLPTLVIFGSNGKLLGKKSGSNQIIDMMSALSAMSNDSEKKIEDFLQKQ